MTQEEKLEEAKRLYKTANADQKYVLERLFPELAESEDERIRKKLISLFQSNNTERFGEFTNNQFVAWLEKQGDINRRIQEEIEKQTKQQWKSEKQDDNVNGECNDTALEKQLEIWFEKGKCSGIDDVIFHPQKYGLEKQGEKGTNGNEREIPFTEQKPTVWSEEDELHIRELESLVKQVWATAEHEDDKDTIHKMSDLSFFLKTLNPQSKQEWSEEDKEIRNELISHFESLTQCIVTEKRHKENRRWLNWLKSLRPQNTWKPSDGQMKQLGWVAEQNKDNIIGKELMTLYKDLKKLREE